MPLTKEHYKDFSHFRMHMAQKLPTPDSSLMQLQFRGNYGQTKHWQKGSGASFVLIILSATRMGWFDC